MVCQSCRRFGVAIAFVGALAVHGHGVTAPPAADRAIAQNIIIRRNPFNGRRAVPASGTGQSTFVVDRDLTRGLAAAEAKLAQGQFHEAFSSLQRILDHPRDSFIPSKASANGYISLKAKTEALLSTVNKNGRATYELQFGHEARQQLERALATNNAAQLQDLSRRFFLTKAGFEATYLLGCHYLDHAEPISAALCFERLLAYPAECKKWEPVLSLKTAVCWARGGRPQRSARTLVNLKEAAGQDALELSGRKIPFFETKDDAFGWLAEILGPQKQPVSSPSEEWAVFRGDASRNARSVDSVPVGEEILVSATLGTSSAYVPANDSEVSGVRPFTWQFLRARLAVLAQLQSESNATTLPATHPLIVGDVIIYRTFRNLKAISVSTGQLLWKTIAPDPAFRDLSMFLDNNVTESSENTERLSAQQTMLRNAADRFLKQRAWHDVTSGTLSSDGHAVFAINETGIDGSFGNLTNNPLRESFAITGHNKLTAFEVRSGRFLWEVGGPSDAEIEDHRGQYELGAAGSFFLGPPLPHKKLLFCLVETNGEIRLEARNPASGKLDWEQPLMMPDLSVIQNSLRRQSGISPAYADGFMVCPTTAGSIVAVNLDRRVLSWVYQYPTKIERHTETNPFARRFRGRRGRVYSMASFNDESRWVDAVPTIADGRVILTPRDSNELHCVNLDDGSLAWKKPRGEKMYVAAVHDGAVVVVGRSKVQAFRLDDGEPVWKHELPVPVPSGRGVHVRNVYHLPLSTGDVATIDLRTGSLLARSRARQKYSPGNLVAAKSALVSQSSDAIVVFLGYEELVEQYSSDLNRNPRDPKALALRGAARLHLGQTESGLADLRASLATKPSPIARTMIVDVLLERLRIDFDRHRDAVPEIKRLANDPFQQAQFLRLYADGLTNAGDRVNAFGAYLKLAALESGDDGLERVDGSHFVRSGRRVQAVIRSTYARAVPDERQLLDQMLKEQLKSARAGQTPRSLQALSRFSPNEAVAISARQTLAERFVVSENNLELEFLSKRMVASDDPSAVRAATARLAWLYLKNGRAQARPLLHRLSTEWKDKLCLDNKTGGQLVTNWSKLAQQIPSIQPWPDQPLQAEKVERETPIERFYSIPFRGDASSAPTTWRLKLDQQLQNVAAHDERGNELWRLKVADAPLSISSSAGNYVRSYGHLLVLTLGNRFVVLDTLAKNATPKLLWQRNLFSGSIGPANSGGVRVQPLFLPGGRRRFGIADQFGQPIGMVGIVNDDFICYQAGSRLFAAEPLTGKILWVKHDIPFGSEYFGDREFVCVPDGLNDQLIILRATDGATIGKRDPGDLDMRFKTIGHRELGVKIVGNRQRISLYDPVAVQTIWQREFD